MTATLRPWTDESIAANGQPVRDNFSQWFHGSQVVDPMGQPLVVHHGTPASFDAFWPAEEGIFFAESTQNADFYAGDKDGLVISAHLCITNPLRMTWREYLRGVTDAGLNHHLLGNKGLKELGHDGLHLSLPDPTDPAMSSCCWVAFHPRQIKSATHNSGLYVSTSSSITDHEAHQALLLATQAKRACPHPMPKPHRLV